MVKPKFSPNYWAVRKRIQRLPRLVIGQMKAKAKHDAQRVIEVFQDGISQQNLRLQRLKPATIKKKAERGWMQPTTPLYGIGFDDSNTYVNMLEVVNVGDRKWAVRPKKGLHRIDPDEPQKKRIPLKVLFDVHEYGATITNGFGRGIFIRIPPRPALRYSYRRYMAMRMKEDPSVKVRVAIAKYVQEGDASALARIEKKLLKETTK
jgi:hypothetical protein